jgi:hypothetical protein
MKKMILLECLILFFVPIAWAQEKFEAPSLTIGDKWIYKNEGGDTWKQEVIAEDDSYYLIKHGKETRGYDKKTMNLVFTVDQNGRRTKFTGTRGQVLNFPLFIGKKWALMAGNSLEEYFVSSDEEVETAAGKFKATKIEYSQKQTQTHTTGRHKGQAWSETAHATYWYAPEAKAIVKRIEKISSTTNMELISYKLK